MHVAAKTNNVELVEILIWHGANICIQDNYGNVSLHCAARCGSAKITEILAMHAMDNANKVLNGNAKLTRDGVEFLSLIRVTSLFQQFLEERCLKSELQYFRKEWVCSAVSRLYNSTDNSVETTTQLIGEPAPKTINYVLHNINSDDFPDYWSSEKIWIPTIPTPSHLQRVLHKIFLSSCIDCINKLE